MAEMLSQDEIKSLLKVPVRKEEIEKIFKQYDVLKEVQFLLSSGNHSDMYLQCALALQHPGAALLLARALCNKIEDTPDVVIGPALGGITLAYEVARQFNVRGIFAEREEGKMTLRRGFQIKPLERVLVCEDVLTTGCSVKEVMELVWKSEGDVMGVAAIVDRSGGKLNLGAPLYSLVTLNVKKWEPEKCPLCKRGIPFIKPGSKNTS